MMAFGQQTGSPAPAKQVEELLRLLHDAGHEDFRDARGPMGFNQRQAAGRFSRDEATAFIEQLQAAADLDPTRSEAAPSARTAPTARLSTAEQAVRRLPAEQLAAELRRRGWTVTEP
jgi:hypothetical protein